MFRRRSPYGERGLKYRTPDRGMAVMSRSPYGERGLKYRHGQVQRRRECRSPYGERGLKYREFPATPRSQWSLSLRRAWIEIPSLPHIRMTVAVALLTENVD